MDIVYKKACNFFLLTLRIICICTGFSLATNTFAAISISASTPTADGSFTLTWSGVTVRYQLYENDKDIDGGTTQTQKLITGRLPATYSYRIDDYCPPAGGGNPVKCGSSSVTVTVNPVTSSSSFRASSSVASSVVLFSSSVVSVNSTSSRSSLVASSIPSSIRSSAISSSSPSSSPSPSSLAISSFAAASSKSSIQSSNAVSSSAPVSSSSRNSTSTSSVLGSSKSSTASSGSAIISSSVSSASVTFTYFATVPTTTGDYTINWEGARTYVILYEKVNGLEEYRANITGSGKQSYPVYGRAPGVYEYVLHECQTGQQTVCTYSNYISVVVPGAVSSSGTSVSSAGSSRAQSSAGVSSLPNAQASSSSNSSIKLFSFYATTPTASGDYTINWDGARTYVILYEKINGLEEYKTNITGSGQQSYSVYGRAPGVYEYVLHECQAGQQTICEYNNFLTVSISGSASSLSSGNSSGSSSSAVVNVSSASNSYSSSLLSSSRASSSASSLVFSKYEAEAAAVFSGVAITRENAGYSGTGYGDYNAAQGSFLEWNIVQDVAGSAQLLVHYSNGNAPSRPMDLFINGVKAGSKTFATTKSWTTWADEVYSVVLRAGTNQIKLVAATTATGANIDYIGVSEMQSVSSSASSTNLVQSGSDFVTTIKNESAINPSPESMPEATYLGTVRGTSHVAGDGSFNYSIPLSLPSGINGMQPGLQLAYNSNAKNGLVGWGWSVGGLSVISRCNASMVRDGYTSGIQSADAYKYCLDGQRLVEVSPNEYRLESESFLRIKRSSNYWEVSSNSAVTSRYGYNSDGKLEDDQGQAYAWYLDRQTDLAGNSWTVSYAKTNSGGIQSHYPDTIAYKIDPIFGALNTVKFHYESRDDISVKYIAGVKVKTDKRLSKVEVKSSGNTVSIYNLAYQKSGQTYQGKPYSDPAKTSRLASVNQCFGSSATLCTAPVEFDWNLQSEVNYLMSLSGNTKPINFMGAAPLDVNNDGTVDSHLYAWVPDIDGDKKEEVRYLRIPGNSDKPAIESKITTKATIKTIDINRDGYDDVVKEYKTVKGIEVYLNSGGEVAVTPSANYSIPKEELSYPAVVEWRQYISQGPYEMYQDTDPTILAYNTAFVDVNGDGLPDLVRSPYDCFGIELYCVVKNVPDTSKPVAKDISVAINMGNGFAPFVVWYDNWIGAAPNCSGCAMTVFKINFADLNGDSLIDLLASAVFPDATQHLVAGYNNGLGKMGGAFIVESLGVSNSRNQLQGDFNGDGLIDFVKLPMKGNYELAPEITDTSFTVNLGIGKPLAISNSYTHKGFDVAIEFHPKKPLLRFCGNSRVFDAAIRDYCFRAVKDFNNDGLDDVIEYGVRRKTECADGSPFVDWNSCTNYSVKTTTIDSEAQVYLSLGGGSQGGVEFSDPVIYKNYAMEISAGGAGFGLLNVFDDYDSDGTLEDDWRFKNNVRSNRIEKVVESWRTVQIDFERLSSNIIYSFMPLDNPTSGYQGYLPGTVGSLSSHSVQHREMGRRIGVARVTESNGAGGTNKTEYKYFGAKTHGAGYGDLGFAQIEKLETVEGKTPLKTITSYYQKADSSDYKLAGKIKRQRVYSSDASWSESSSALLSETRNQWKVRIYSDDVDSGYKSPHYFAYLYKSSSQQWDLDGTKIADAQIQNQKDAIASCDLLAESPAIVVTSAGSAADNDYTTEGVLVYSQTATCDQSGSAASVQIKAMENLDITQKGNARGLVQKQKAYAWVGTAVSAATKSAYDSRTQSFTYNTLGQLESKTIEPDATAAAAIKLTTTYGYNGLGSVNSVTETWDDTANDGLDVVTRTTSINESYDSAGVRTVEVTSPLNLKETTKYHAVWGLPVSEVDANGLETKRDYDAYGRPQLITYADNTKTTIDYRSCSGCSLYYPNATWYQQIKTTGSAAVRTYYDGFNREIGTRSKGLKGQDVYTWQSYNSRGDVYQTAEPFFYGGSQQTVTRTYDALGRVSNVSYPDSSSDVFTYNGLRHTTTNRLNQTQTRYLNAAGWVIRSQDNANTPVDFTYWPWGDLKTSQVNSDVKTQVNVVYDKLGRKTEMTDPNTGKTTYTYNALGLVATQTDAKNQRTCFGYDALGRQVKRVDKASNSCTGTTQNWYYDTSAYGKGQLASLSGVSTDGSSYSEAYSYTNKGLPETTSYSMGVNSYSVTQHYDSFSRPLGVTYPTGYVVANRYNSYGHLSEVADSAGVRVWKADDADALGNLKQFTLGNGVVTNQTYDAFNNRIETIRAVKGSVVIQDQRYQFDSLGNLTSREDRKNVVTQSFCYDGLNRLKAARFNGCSSAINDYVYDALGNLTAKVIDEQAQGQSLAMGYGTNGTNVAGPHAVTSANGWTYKYDAIGNLETATKTGESTRTVQYSPFNTPTSITQGSKFSTIVYGPNQDRINHSDSNGRVTKYVGGIYEEVTLNGETQKIHYVGDMALFISKGENTSATYGYEYLHRDHVGSIVALSKGTITSALDVQWQANGAWGERRYQQWNGPLDNMLIPLNTARGFTDHEHLDSVGLIHMNGRVYDPELGRFMSADPFVQAPYNTQSYNRYSYVFNNPLSFTDPSGYQSCGYSECSDVEESPPAIGDRDAYERQRQQDAFTNSNNQYWHSWANYQSMVADATAGLLYSQMIVNGGSITWHGIPFVTSVATAGGGSIVVGGSGGGAGGGILDGLGKLLSVGVRGAGGILISSLALTGSSERKNGVALYRAASLAEINDIMKCSCFRPGPNSYEGKLFARIMADAQIELRHLKELDKKLGMPTEYGIVITRVSEEYFRTLEQIPNVDRLISPVVNVHFDQLPAFNAEARRHGIYWKDE